MAYNVYKLAARNCEKMRLLYEDFEAKALESYGFEFLPIDFKTFCAALNQQLLHALILYEDEMPQSLLIYSLSDIDKTVEINVIHSLSSKNIKEKHTLLLTSLLNFLDPKAYSLISYPMLGIQSEFTRHISNLGFKLVSQSIFRFNLDEKTSLKIFKHKEVNAPAHLSLIKWNEKYFNETAALIHNSFKESADALYDRRFLDLKGCEDVLEKITKDIYGKMLKKASFLLIDKEKPIAFCFANLSSPQIANIPLIGCQKEFSSMGLGSFLLKQSVGKIIEEVIKEKLFVVEINATASAQNNSSMRMYRSLGFKEDISYTHSYCELT